MAVKKSPYGTTKFTTIDEYHRNFPKDIRDKLDLLRTAVRQAAPRAEETISYNMPAFRQGKVLVYYAVNKEHIGFYPTPNPIRVFAKELADYKTSKGAIQLPLNKRIPVTLIKKIVKFRKDEENLKQAGRALG